MNEEQKSRLAEISEVGGEWNDIPWLLALVKELDEDRAHVQQAGIDAEAGRVRAEQQLAAVTAENARLAFAVERAEAERDELRHEVERLTEKVNRLHEEREYYKGNAFGEAGRAEKAEAERDALKALVAMALTKCSTRECGKLATHSEPFEPGRWACDEHARPPMGRVFYSKQVLELARLKGEKGSG